NQYVVFTKVMDGQARIYGRTRAAVREAMFDMYQRDGETPLWALVYHLLLCRVHIQRPREGEI
ncbi:MAG: hypothetical protein LUE23_06715, partial [Lachnospiraceae bacterium]|nr:hypothetical protein [Lachnospiraceae bacterium]